MKQLPELASVKCKIDSNAFNFLSHNNGTGVIQSRHAHPYTLAVAPTKVDKNNNLVIIDNVASVFTCRERMLSRMRDVERLHPSAKLSLLLLFHNRRSNSERIKLLYFKRALEILRVVNTIETYCGYTPSSMYKADFQPYSPNGSAIGTWTQNRINQTSGYIMSLSDVWYSSCHSISFITLIMRIAGRGFWKKEITPQEILGKLEKGVDLLIEDDFILIEPYIKNIPKIYSPEARKCTDYISSGEGFSNFTRMVRTYLKAAHPKLFVKTKFSNDNLTLGATESKKTFDNVFSTYSAKTLNGIKIFTKLLIEEKVIS